MLCVFLADASDHGDDCVFVWLADWWIYVGRWLCISVVGRLVDLCREMVVYLCSWQIVGFMEGDGCVFVWLAD